MENNIENSIWLLIGLIGLCLGSFVYVIIYRFSPQKTLWQYLYAISCKRSRCPNCRHHLPFLTLIPVLSWLILRGKCKYCSRPISLHYMLTECLIALYCLGIVFFFNMTIQSIILILLGLLFIILAAIDLRYFLLPNFFIYTLFMVGVATAYFKIGTLSLDDSLLGILIGFLLLWLPAKSYSLIKGKEGLGRGDIKLLAALGAWVNYSQLPLLLVIASVLGLLHFSFIYYMQLIPRKKITMIPFGPSLLTSAYGLLLIQYY